MPRSASRSQTRFKAVVFDAYGTLFDVHSVASLAEQLFPGNGDTLSRLWRQKQLEYSWLRAMSRRYKPFWEITRDALIYSAAHLSLELSSECEDRLMNQYSSLSAFPENLQALREMKAAGLPLGILTNGNREMIEVAVRSAGMGGLFDHVLSSDTVQTFKTMDTIYDLAPEAFDCRSRDILFVSSNCWVAIGSRYYGFTSFWINRGGLPLDRLDLEPDYIGRQLTEVLKLVQASGAKKTH